MPAKAKGNPAGGYTNAPITGAVGNVGLGLYFDRPQWQIPSGGLAACNNVRIWQQRLMAFNMGWSSFGLSLALNGPCTLIDTFIQSDGTQIQIFGTPTDLYQYVSGGSPNIVWITPNTTSGTVSINNGSPTLTGSSTTSFTATISGTTLTVTAVASGTLFDGLIIAGTSVTSGSRILAQLTGAPGGDGTYQLSAASTVGSGETMTTSDMAWLHGDYPIKAGDKVYVGTAGETDPTSTPWYTVLTVNSNTSITLTANYAGTTVSGAAYTIRQLFTGDAQNHIWSSETFPNANYPIGTTQDVWMATDGADYPVIWNGVSSTVTYLFGFPFKCFIVRRFQDLMCYGGLVNASGTYQPTGFANSDAATPTNLSSGLANQYTMTDDNYIINAMQPLGNVLMLYTTGEVVSAQFVGQPLNWVFTKVIRGRGLLASRLLATFPDRHQFISQDGQYRYNGLYVQLMNTQVWRQIISNFDLSRANRGFGTVNEQFGDIMWALPLTTDTNNPGLNTAYVEHYLEQPQSYLQKPFTQRDFPFTVSGSYTQQPATTTWNLLTNSWQTYQNPWNSNIFTGSYPLPLVGDLNGNVWTLYSTDLQNTTGYASFAQFGQRITVNERSRGLVTRVYPGAAYNATGYNLTITLTMYDQVGGAPQIVDTQTMPLNYSGNRFTTHYRRGRLGQVTFGTSGPSQPWELQGYDWDVRQGGLR